MHPWALFMCIMQVCIWVHKLASQSFVMCHTTELTFPLAQNKRWSGTYTSLYAPVKTQYRWRQPLASYVVVVLFLDQKWSTHFSHSDVLECTTHFCVYSFWLEYGFMKPLASHNRARLALPTDKEVLDSAWHILYVQVYVVTWNNLLNSIASVILMWKTARPARPVSFENSEKWWNFTHNLECDF